MIKYLPLEEFTYSGNRMKCEDVFINEIIEQTGTPVYIYSKSHFERQYKRFSNAFKEIKHKIFYAVKSNYNLNVIKTFTDLGSGVDVNSEGELHRALKLGIFPKNIILTGVGKTESEIRLGLEKELLMIKVESEEELLSIDKIAGSLNKIAPVAIRVNPDVDPQTHPYISTGLAENKFGVEYDSAYYLYKVYKDLPNVRFVGIDMHIGSQILTPEPFREATEKIAELYVKLKELGIKLEHFDTGGGFGVNYRDKEPFEIDDFAQKIIPALKKFDCDIFFEPGRFLTANGGILVTKAQYTKSNLVKSFIVVDAAMTDLLRPGLYRAYHHVQPVEIKPERDEITVDVVGGVCESSDFLAKDRVITEVKKDEYLAVMSAGAYGMVMSSNYNGRRRPPEVLVEKNSFKIIRSRETYDSLLWDEEKYI